MFMIMNWDESDAGRGISACIAAILGTTASRLTSIVLLLAINATGVYEEQ